MTQEEVARETREFILEHLKSVAALDLLLFFFAKSAQSLTVEQLSREMRSNPNMIAELIEDFEKKSLVKAAKEPDPAQYSLADLPEEKYQQVVLLSELALKRRYTIIEIIYLSPIEKLRLFSSAFKVRK